MLQGISVVLRKRGAARPRERVYNTRLRRHRLIERARVQPLPRVNERVEIRRAGALGPRIYLDIVHNTRAIFNERTAISS